jgi:hypothetical protein
VPDQDQQAYPGQEAGHDGGEQRFDAADRNQPRQDFGIDREQAHRDEGLGGELPAQGAYGKHVEGQVDGEYDGAHRPAARVMDQEGKAHRAAREQTGLAEQQYGEGDEQRCDKQRLDVFGQAVGDLGGSGHGRGCWAESGAV